MRSHLVKIAAVALFAITALALASHPSRADQAGKTVVFVCEHGSSKSVVAAELFNRTAQERGVSLRAVSRAVSAETRESKVPPGLVRSLSADGFNVGTFEPQALAEQEASSAVRVVVMNYDGKVESAGNAKVEHWNELPGVITQYDNAKKEMSSRIDALLKDLTKDQAKQ